MIKTLKKLGVEGTYFNLMKAIKSKANIMFNRGKTENIFSKSGTRQGGPLLPLLFNIGLEVLARAIRQEKEIRDIQICIYFLYTGKEEVELFIFSDDMRLYLENPNSSARKLIGLIKTQTKTKNFS